MANQWLTGSGVPSTGIGQVTDYYRDTVSNLVYYRENAFTWVVVPAFTPSPDGIGTTWLHGNVPPLTGQGSDGDYFYEDTHKIVYRKEGSTWVAKGSLDFIGIYGVQWGNGLGAPVSNVPLDALPAGSFYLDVVTSDIYYKGPSMSWELKGQLGGGGTSVDVATVGSDHFPRYDQAQTLTEPQKAQILTNIGAKKSYNMLTKTAPYALQLADFKDAVDLYDKVYLRMNLTAIGDVTIGTALTSLPNLTEISVRDLGTARATLVESGTVLNGIKTFTVQNEVKTLIKVGANEWDVIGALT